MICNTQVLRLNIVAKPHILSTGVCRLGWPKGSIEYIDSTTWNETPFFLRNSQLSVLLGCHYERKDNCFHIWLWSPIDVEDAAKLECAITVSKKVLFRGTVFSMLWDRQKVLQENHLRVSYDMMMALAKRYVFTNAFCFKVSFKVWYSHPNK